MNTELHYRVTYTSVDGIPQIYENSGMFLHITGISFQYIQDYYRTRKLPNELPDYVPVIVDYGFRKSDALTDAMLFLHDNVERMVVWQIANRCAKDSAFAELVMNEATKLAKGSSDQVKREWAKKKRNIRSHIKAGKDLWSDYCGIIFLFELYQITHFDFEPLN